MKKILGFGCLLISYQALAKDIISDDASFVKALTREDGEYLFS